VTITSGLKEKGYRIEGGTTLIKLPTASDKPYKQEDRRNSSSRLRLIPAENLSAWAKTRVPIEDYKELKKMAVDKDVSLAELLRQALKLLMEKEGGK